MGGPDTRETDTKDLDALLNSLNGSADRLQTLWFSFLGLTLYLAITAAGTTHRMLLLREPQTLPILNIKIDLLAFYFIAPPLYLVFHLYVLLMLMLLARTAAPFESELRATLPIEADRERYRARIGNALFLQLLVGPNTKRAGFNGVLLTSIAVITIVLGPIWTLILMQWMFLPYHDLTITWWHRVLVLADLALIIAMGRSLITFGRVENPLLSLFPPRERWRDGWAVADFTVIGMVLLLSFWEGRWAGEKYIGRADISATSRGFFGGPVDRLFLSNEIIVGESRLDEVEREITSRGGSGFVPTRNFDHRDLQAAVLPGADLRAVSLLGADMRGADLEYARLEGASLDRAQLQGADLKNARLQGAYLDAAQLQGADLNNARLQGAHLGDPQLQGADLRQARLQGADLSRAQLQGADLNGAQLQGADLDRAQLQGADLNGAQMQGAQLPFALLQGADLRQARLQGADLRGAGLQGADLGESEMSDSEFDATFVFRTGVNHANMSTSAIRSVEADRFLLKKGDNSTRIEPLTPADVEGWNAVAMEFAGQKDKSIIAGRFARLKPDFQTAQQDSEDHAKWSELEKQSVQDDPDGAQHRRRLAAIFGDLACEADGAPDVARGILVARYFALGDQFDAVRNRMKAARKEPEKCPGAAHLSQRDWDLLDAINPVQDQNAPKAPPTSP